MYKSTGGIIINYRNIFVILIIIFIVLLAVSLWLKPKWGEINYPAQKKRYSDEEISKELKILKEAKKYGVIKEMPADIEKYMDMQRKLKAESEEWARQVAGLPYARDSEGFPNYEQLYPLAIEKHMGRELLPEEMAYVKKAAKHLDNYWRSRKQYPQKDGKPDWVTIYGQIQDHYRQCITR